MECFVALGGNFGNTQAVFRRSLSLLAQSPGIECIETSRLYCTSPVSEIAQEDFLNAVCRFDCTLPLNELWHTLKKIETLVGKTPKPKNAPRMIDLDLLFYGDLHFHSNELTIPHPKWDSRLFVMLPLSELVHDNSFPSPKDLQKLINHFSNTKEKVVPITDPHPFREILTCSR